MQHNVGEQKKRETLDMRARILTKMILYGIYERNSSLMYMTKMVSYFKKN